MPAAKWVIPKKDQELWFDMVHAASKRVYEGTATAEDNAIISISKHLSMVERDLKGTNQIAYLLQKAKKGKL